MYEAHLPVLKNTRLSDIIVIANNARSAKQSDITVFANSVENAKSCDIISRIKLQNRMFIE